ncbi:MAG: histidinol-phosphate transaminase [Planctomycetota bacterium]|jgi:histidinol-phosphate aminotransferase
MASNKLNINNDTNSSRNITILEKSGIKKSPINYFRDEIIRAEGYKPGFQPKESHAVKLNTNENPYPPSPAVLKSLAQMGADKLRRYPDPLANDFRTAAAEIHGVKPENIMCFKGSDELLSIAIRAFCDRGRPVAYPVPTYSLYGVLAKLQGCANIEVPFDEEFNLSDGLARADAALTIVCNPNSPTATWVPIKTLAQLAEKLTGVLLIDEAYVDFVKHKAVKLVNHYDNVIILRSLSKGYSLAGLRFGYAIAHEEIIEGFLKIKDSYNVDSVAIAIAAAAIRDQAHFESNVKKVMQGRTVLTKQLRQLGFEVSDSYTNFILAEPPVGSAVDLKNELARRSIYVRYFNTPRLRNKLRITIGTADKNARLVTIGTADKNARLVTALRDILDN